MNVLVTGGAGYIGSVLISVFLRHGYKIKCLDRFFFGEHTLDTHKGDPNLILIKDDVRWFDPEILRDVNAVIDLAALSNDPAGILDPKKTYEINFEGRARVAELAKKYGVGRYILASSCSIYGFQNCIANEDSPVNPLSIYAKANLKAENHVLPMSDDRFCVTVLRQATVYGLSPRMRFDLAINGMVLSLFKEGKVPIMRDGTQWRPYVHIKDTSNAFKAILESPNDDVNGEIFNVGSNDQNLQILPLAQLIAESVDVPFNFEWHDSLDTRSYRVDFTKIRDSIGFETSFTPSDGAREIYAALKAGTIKDDARTRSIDWLKHRRI